MASPTTPTITSATPADVPTLGTTLASAFHDDPVLAWLVPDADRRQVRLPALFGAFADVYVPQGESYLVGDDAGGALWAPPGGEPVPEHEAEAFGQRLGAILQGDVTRAVELQELFDEHHPQVPHYYLQFVGIVPEHQGRGLGSQLLTTVLAHADATSTPAYLEATSPDNRRLYERHGFDTIGEIILPDGPAVWPMWRDPRTPPA